MLENINQLGDILNRTVVFVVNDGNKTEVGMDSITMVDGNLCCMLSPVVPQTTVPQTTLVSDLTDEQLLIVMHTRPDWIFDHRPSWMVANEPDWVGDRRPAWMSENRPAWMVENRPEWMAENRPDLLNVINRVVPQDILDLID